MLNRSGQTKALALTTLTFVLMVGPLARAQGAAYVSGSIFGDLKRFSGSASGTALDGEAIGGAAAVGTSISDQWDVEFGVDLPRSSEVVEERSLTLRSSRVTLFSITRNRVSSVSSLVRFRPANSGLRLGYIVGLVFVRMREELETVAPDDVPSSLIPRPVETIVYAVSPMVGIDAQWSIGPGFSVVPALSAFAIRAPEISGVVVRPRVGIRWIF